MSRWWRLRQLRASHATVAVAVVGVVVLLGSLLILRSPPAVHATWVADGRSPASDTSPGTGPGSPSSGPNAPCGGWDCAIQSHFAAAEALVAEQAGALGIIVRDRVTGLVWQAGTPTREVWTASTIKLAIAADLLARARNGELTITATIRRNLDDMLEFSANAPATSLWPTHGGPKALQRYQSVFGMTGIRFPTAERLWGAVKCTTQDLAALMAFILDKMHPDDRDYLIRAMRSVHQVQRWGVYAAGTAQAPGTKNGWNVEKNETGQDHWVTDSIGFAGQNERYIISVMYALPGNTQLKGHTLDAGVHAVSDVVATVFGATVPASVPPNSMLLNPPTS